MPTTPILQFRADRVDPIQDEDLVKAESVNLSPGVYLKGTLLGQVTTPNNPAVPAAPAPTTATTGGTVAASAYGIEVTYVNSLGETTASAAGTVTTTGATSTITVPSPPASGNAAGYYVYATGPGGATYARQQPAGLPTALGTAFTLTAPPTATGATPPASNTANAVVGAYVPYAAANTDGSGTARGILVYSCTATAPVAGDTTGIADVGYGSEYGRSYKTTPMYYRGTFATADLVGLDQVAVTAMGALLFKGSLANGKIVIG